MVVVAEKDRDVWHQICKWQYEVSQMFRWWVVAATFPDQRDNEVTETTKLCDNALRRAGQQTRIRCAAKGGARGKLYKPKAAIYLAWLYK